MKMLMKLFVFTLLMTASSVSLASAQDGGNGGDGGNCDAGNDCNGGDGSDASAAGQPGKPGCDGGTDPSPDGKFYLPGTRQECSPGEGDREKLNDLPATDSQ